MLEQIISPLREMLRAGLVVSALVLFSFWLFGTPLTPTFGLVLSLVAAAVAIFPVAWASSLVTVLVFAVLTYHLWYSPPEPHGQLSVYVCTWQAVLWLLFWISTLQGKARPIAAILDTYWPRAVRTWKCLVAVTNHAVVGAIVTAAILALFARWYTRRSQVDQLRTKAEPRAKYVWLITQAADDELGRSGDGSTPYQQQLIYRREGKVSKKGISSAIALFNRPRFRGYLGELAEIGQAMNESYGIETGYPMNEFRSIEIKLEEFSTFDWHSQKEEGGYILLDDKSLAPMDALDQAVRSIWSLCIRHVQDARELGLPQDNKPRLVGPAVNQAENPSTRDVPW